MTAAGVPAFRDPALRDPAPPDPALPDPAPTDPAGCAALPVRDGLRADLTRGRAPLALPMPERMSDRAVARLVKRCAAAAGYDAAAFAGHSLRAGFLTEAAAHDATVFKMQEVSRHRTVQILSDYVRAADRFRDHAGDRFL